MRGHTFGTRTPRLGKPGGLKGLRMLLISDRMDVCTFMNIRYIDGK